MENEFFLNAGIQRPPPLPQLHLDAAAPASSCPTTLPNWHSNSLTRETDEFQDCLFNQNWENSATEQSVFGSAISSLVSSPATVASDLNISNDCFMVGELIEKLGNIGNSSSGEILPSSSANCYSTPLNSDHTPPRLVKKPPPGSSVAPLLSADPAFAERAARFSCFGSRSFNGRTTMFTANNNSGWVNRADAAYWTLPRVSQQIPNGGEVSTQFSRKRKSAPRGKVKENSACASPSPNSTKADEAIDDANSKKFRHMEKNTNEKSEEETEEKKGKNNNKKPPEPPKDYIHVRARRGQATDSHSLAERVRREKISERMRLLQGLVPGCSKVTGKAPMLDEIIKYVQSLQRQVEFLSMKLSSVNTRLDFNVDSLLSKNIIQSDNSTQNPIFSYDSSAASVLGQQSLKHPTAEAGSLGTLPQISTDHFAHTQIRSFTSNAPQYPTFCEDELQTIVQMGLGQNPLNFHGSNQGETSH